jgi:hypothetical protein
MAESRIPGITTEPIFPERNPTEPPENQGYLLNIVYTPETGLSVLEQKEVDFARDDWKTDIPSSPPNGPALLQTQEPSIELLCRKDLEDGCVGQCQRGICGDCGKYHWFDVCERHLDNEWPKSADPRICRTSLHADGVLSEVGLKTASFKGTLFMGYRIQKSDVCNRFHPSHFNTLADISGVPDDIPLIAVVLWFDPTVVEEKQREALEPFVNIPGFMCQLHNDRGSYPFNHCVLVYANLPTMMKPASAKKNLDEAD